MVSGLAAIAAAIAAPIARFLANEPVSRTALYTLNEQDPNMLPDPQTLTEQRWRRIIPEEEYKLSMKRQGFDEAESDKLFNTVQAKVPIPDLISLHRRGIIDTSSFATLMKRHKLTEAQIEALQRTTEVLPGTQDLIKFAVREVFDTDVVQKFGMDMFFPPKFAEEGLKIGLQPEQAINFWRSHWILPSVSLGLQMFHRLRPKFNPTNPVDDAEIDTLLRIQDIMPFWIPRIKEISFLLPTRVDLRRMFVGGLIDRSLTKSVYEQLGYPENWAEKLTQLAEAIKQDDEFKLTKSLILDSMKVGDITDVQAAGFLIDIGFSPDAAALTVSLELQKKKEKELNKRVELARDKFVKGFTSTADFDKELDSLNLMASRKELVLAEGLIDKEKRRKVFTKADTRLLFKTGGMETEEAILMLVINGYSQPDAERIIKSWGAAQSEEGGAVEIETG